MTVAIVLPDLGMDCAVFSLWHVQSGERVYAGDRVAEIVVPGVVYDVSAPASGIVRDRLVAAQEPLQPGQVLGAIEIDPDF